MTNYALRTDRSTGRVGFYQLNGTSGDPTDPNSTMNLPLNNPATYLDLVKFHVDLDHLEVLASGSISITHPAVSGLGANPTFLATKYGVAAGTDDQLIVDLTSFGLTVPPFAIVAASANGVSPGMPTVTNSDGGAWYVTPYCTTTALRLAAAATIGSSNLPATAVTYSYLVFKKPPAASGHTLISFTRSTGVTAMGKGKFSSDRAYLQVVSGGSPLGLSLGRTIDLNNGAPKDWRPDGTTYAPVPAGLESFLPAQAYGGTGITGSGAVQPLGASMAYGGSYAGPSAVQVQAP